MALAAVPSGTSLTEMTILLMATPPNFLWFLVVPSVFMGVTKTRTGLGLDWAWTGLGLGLDRAIYTPVRVW